MTSPALITLLRAVSAAAKPVVLIDGGAGSGKSTLAQQIVTEWPTASVPQVVCTDEFCRGWDGLAAASDAVAEVITDRRFTTWDWHAEGPGEVRQLDAVRPLIIEGCGSITPASRELATLAIWLDAPEPVRKRRALARDGQLFAPHWERWAAQEAQHWATNRPWDLADISIDID